MLVIALNISSAIVSLLNLFFVGVDCGDCFNLGGMATKGFSKLILWIAITFTLESIQFPDSSVPGKLKIASPLVLIWAIAFP
jgi:hypothetical protein